MLTATEQAGADLPQIMLEIGEELLVRYPEALGTLRLGVLRIENYVRPCGIEFKVPANRKGGDTAPSDEPEAEETQKQPVTKFSFSLLMTVAGRGKRLIHEFHAEVENQHGRHQPVEAILGMSLGS